MLQTYFKLLTNCFFLDSLRNFVAQEMTIIETSENMTAFQAIFLEGRGDNEGKRTMTL